MAGRLPDDEGFSLLEVLFASFIAFFVLTALFGVLVMSATEGRIANADTVSTNLCQLVVEQARALPYTSLGVTPTPPGEVSGVLLASEPTTYQGIRFTIQRHVEWVHDASSTVSGSKDYKKLTVAVSWPGGHATPVITYVRDHTNESPMPPLVAWTVSPPASAVLFWDAVFHQKTYIWDKSTNPSGTVNGADGLPVLASLQASASVVTTSGSITNVELQNNARRFGPTFSGSGPSVIFPSSPYLIDLTMTTTTPSGETTAVFREGLNTVRVIATANTMGYAYQILLLTVDNYPPQFGTSGPITITLPTDNTDRHDGSFAMSWPTAYDGNDASSLYDLWIDQYRDDGVIVSVPYGMQDYGNAHTYLVRTNSPSLFIAKPFSPYRVTLSPKSVRGLPGNARTSAWGSNAVRLTGSVYNNANTKKDWQNGDNLYRFDLTISQPLPDEATFASVFGGTSIVYDVYSMRIGDGYVYPGSGDLPSGAVLEKGNEAYASPLQVESGVYCDKYLQVEAKVLADDGTVVKRVRSNVIGALTEGPAWRQSLPLPIP